MLALTVCPTSQLATLSRTPQLDNKCLLYDLFTKSLYAPLQICAEHPISQAYKLTEMTRKHIALLTYPDNMELSYD